MDFLVGQAKSLNDPTLRMQTLDAISNVNTCVMHRANLTDAAKNTILTSLKNQGLVRTSDDASAVLFGAGKCVSRSSFLPGRLARSRIE
jgi:hypothetical protein